MYNSSSMDGHLGIFSEEGLIYRFSTVFLSEGIKAFKYLHLSVARFLSFAKLGCLRSVIVQSWLSPAPNHASHRNVAVRCICFSTAPASSSGWIVVGRRRVVQAGPAFAS